MKESVHRAHKYSEFVEREVQRRANATTNTVKCCSMVWLHLLLDTRIHYRAEDSCKDRTVAKGAHRLLPVLYRSMVNYSKIVIPPAISYINNISSERDREIDERSS